MNNNLVELNIIKYLTPEELEAYKMFLKACDVSDFEELFERFQVYFDFDYAYNSSLPDRVLLQEYISDDIVLKMLNSGIINIDNLPKESDLLLKTTLMKIFRVTAIHTLYWDLGLESTLEIVERVKIELMKAMAIEGERDVEAFQDIQHLMENLIDIDRDNKLYSWNFGIKKLNILHDELSKLGYIENDSRIFFECFKSEFPTFREKIIWNNDETDLVFLAYRLWNGGHPKKSHFIAQGRFRKKEKDFNRNLLRRTYHNIASECIHDDDVISKRMDLLEIANKITQ
jgi:hypothetical protein